MCIIFFFKGSTIVMVGLYGGQMALSLPKMIHGMRSITGVLTGTLTQFKELVELTATGKVRSDSINSVSKNFRVW